MNNLSISSPLTVRTTVPASMAIEIRYSYKDAIRLPPPPPHTVESDLFTNWFSKSGKTLYTIFLTVSSVFQVITKAHEPIYNFFVFEKHKPSQSDKRKYPKKPSKLFWLCIWIRFWNIFKPHQMGYSWEGLFISLLKAIREGIEFSLES